MLLFISNSWFSLYFHYYTHPKMGCGSSQVFFLIYSRNNSRTMESYPNLISFSCWEDPAVAKALRLRTSSGTTDFYISRLAIFWEKKGRKVARMLKWLKATSKMVSFCHRHLLSNYWRNVFQFTGTEGICSTDFPEISKTGKNSKSSCHNTLLSETSSISIVLTKFLSKESWVGHWKAVDLTTILKQSRKDWTLLRMKPFQLSKISKAKVIASKSMQLNRNKRFTNNWKKSFLHITLSHQHQLKWFLFWVVQVLERERKIL